MRKGDLNTFLCGSQRPGRLRVKIHARQPIEWKINVDFSVSSQSKKRMSTPDPKIKRRGAEDAEVRRAYSFYSGNLLTTREMPSRNTLT